jgi:alkylated DNA repair dioxygenase AlkB
MMPWQQIPDGSLLFIEGFYPPNQAATLFTWLRSDVPWRQETVNGKPLPRLNAWYADSGLRYSYSGLTHRGTGWLPELLAIKGRVETATETTFNSVLLNLYRDGQDSIGYHTDAEPELGQNPVIATVSFGAEREFVMKHKKSKLRLHHLLGAGSLLVMAGSSQHHWLHAMPKTEEEVGERISLTFRRILQ